MPVASLTFLPADAARIAIVLALSLLVGFEREEQKHENGAYRFGGVRTFPLLGLTGYALALLGGEVLPAAGLVVVGALMFLSYRHKLSASSAAGVTTEVSGLTIYVVGALVCRGYIWVSCALVIVSLLLLELKSALESLTRRIPAAEISTLAKFLLLAVVILPIVPNQAFTQFELNPFTVTVAVVAVCGVSYASYVLEKLDQGRGGILLSAILGGAYSSTVTTIVLSKRCREDQRPELYVGSILAASGVMYARILILLAFFNLSLAGAVAVPFAVLAAAGVGAGWWWSTRGKTRPKGERAAVLARNPLQLEAAAVFAILLTVVLVLTQLVTTHLGKSGTYAFAAVMGVSDVDPFILGLTQTAGKLTPLQVAAASVVIAAASNNLAKGFYGLIFAKGRGGRLALAALAGLAILGLAPLLFL
ncbi:MAG TPA: MgtC/SapB family protein [Gemmatimonadales bacterium]|nr:MgtC/SapB family protein [Gemmatimonadales bacterium]